VRRADIECFARDLGSRDVPPRPSLGVCRQWPASTATREALGANIEALGIERGHRALTGVRKGGKIVIIPLAPRTAGAIDLAIGERVEGPIFLASSGDRLDRHAA
jgi:hypothetical protein